VTAAHRLLQRAFRKDELVSVAEWRDSLVERSAGLWADLCWHLVVAERGGRVIGAATGTYLGNVNIGFVGYLAVARGGRGEGLGSRLRSRLIQLFRRDARRIRRRALEALVGEVRSDNPWLRHLVASPKVLALDFVYLQPRLRAGTHSVPLVLYYESMRGPVSHLSATQVRQLLYTAWRRAYRIPRPLASPTFRRMLESLEGLHRVGELRPTGPARRARPSDQAASRRATGPG
jgi:GNAT superfamily N-acetyltransferase